MHEPALFQLPHVTRRDVSFCARKGVKTVEKFRQLTLKQRKRLLKDMTNQQLVQLTNRLHFYPC